MRIWRPISKEFFRSDRSDRLVQVLDALDAEALLHKLERQRHGRRDEYPIRILWNTLIASIVYERPTVTALIEELKGNPGLRLLCGIRSAKGVPSPWAYSRFLAKLVRNREELEAVFHRLVEHLRRVLPGFGKILVGDSTDIHAWSSPRRKVPGDPDARWGTKRKAGGTQKPGQGEELYHWLGYKLHLLICGTYELPVGFEVTPANKDDGNKLPPLLETAKKWHPELLAGAEFLVADKGYDYKKNYEIAVENYGLQPIIPLNLRGEKEPPGITNSQGTPLCLGNLPMYYAGNDHGYLKYRCPAKCRKGVHCPLRVPCRPLAGYGAVIKLRVNEDYRRHTPLPRETQKWKRLYAQRSAVERVNGRLKEHFLALRVRRQKKVEARLILSLVVMLAGALAMARRERWMDLRRIVQFAAA